MLYSHSRLKSFENCPLKFKYKYLDKLETEIGQGVEAFLGSMVHSALEKLYRDLSHHKYTRLQDLLDWYNIMWDRNWNPSILIVRKEYTKENYKAMGERFISDYYKRHAPFDKEHTIGLEKRIEIKLDPEGRYKLQGFIDRLASTKDGTYEIHDYKTNAELPLNDVLKEDRQLALYAIAVLSDYQDAAKVRLVWHFLAHDKDFVVEKTMEELEALKRDTIQLIEKVEAEKEFGPRPSKLCDWCEFMGICPMKKHEAKVSQLPTNEYLKEPGVKLVNLYAELKDKKTQIEMEMDKVKEALLEYSRRENVLAIRGSDFGVRVWRKDAWRFPGKSDKGREELDAFVRDVGLWDDFSMLDVWKLEKALESKGYPPELVEELKKFATREKVEKLYINKPDSPRD